MNKVKNALMTKRLESIMLLISVSLLVWSGQYNAAINQLNAFINQVEAQRGKKITDEDADALISAAQRIIYNM